MAEIALEPVLEIAEHEWNYVSFDMMFIKGNPGGRIDDTELVNGIVIDK